MRACAIVIPSFHLLRSPLPIQGIRRRSNMVATACSSSSRSERVDFLPVFRSVGVSHSLCRPTDGACIFAGAGQFAPEFDSSFETSFADNQFNGGFQEPSNVVRVIISHSGLIAYLYSNISIFIHATLAWRTTLGRLHRRHIRRLIKDLTQVCMQVLFGLS